VDRAYAVIFGNSQMKSVANPQSGFVAMQILSRQFEIGGGWHDHGK